MIDITNIYFLQDSSDIERIKILLNCCQYELHRNSKYKFDKLYFVFERAAIADHSNTQLGHIMKHLFLMEMRYIGLMMLGRAQWSSFRPCILLNAS